ncbi:MAG: hypothetical protein OXD01_09425 [Gammaproteobacteria bacterium]|nr:hypothetical protein [Gammaproteobacteria bacterium]
MLIVLLLVGDIGSVRSQTQIPSVWNGEWVAEGTLFQIRVTVVNGLMKIDQIESLGQVWSNEDGTVADSNASVIVNYAGASGEIRAELIDPETARVFVASCTPDFMVVCVLSKERQAIFRKVQH